MVIAIFFFMYHGLSKILGEICKNIFVFILASSQCLPYQLWQHILDTYSTKLCLFCDFLDNKRAEKTPFNEEKQNFPCRRTYERHFSILDKSSHGRMN